MSSDDHPGVLTPDMLQSHMRLVDVSDLNDWDANPYEGDVGAAHGHLGTFGQLQVPVVVDGEVLFGQEYVAAERFDAQYGGQLNVLDLTDLEWPREKIVAAVLGLHNIERQASVDAEQLLSLLQEVQKADEQWLAGAGYDGDDLEAIYEQLQRDQEALDGQGGRLAEGVDADDIPDDAPAITQPGDVWIIGPHRVAAGDAADAELMLALTGGSRAAMIFADPPYGVSYADKNRFLNEVAPANRIQEPIEGDHQTPEDTQVIWRAVFSEAHKHLAPGASYYVTGPQGGDLLLLLLLALRESGFPLRHMLIWAKNNHVLGRSDYNYKHEPIIYGWVEGAGHTWYGDHSETSLWEIPKPHKSDLHPTMKPVELVARAMRNSTKRGDLVLDPFGGSGTTLIAAHQEGRGARLVELAPRYVDVICKRAQQATGIKPVLEATGEAHDFTEGD